MATPPLRSLDSGTSHLSSSTSVSSTLLDRKIVILNWDTKLDNIRVAYIMQTLSFIKWLRSDYTNH